MPRGLAVEGVARIVDVYRDIGGLWEAMNVWGKIVVTCSKAHFMILDFVSYLS